MSNIYAENLKKIRLAIGYSAEKMAQELDIPVRTLGGYERGERIPSIELATRLSKLGVNLNWYVTGEGEMFIKTSTSDSHFKAEVEEILKQHGLI